MVTTTNTLTTSSLSFGVIVSPGVPGSKARSLAFPVQIAGFAPFSACCLQADAKAVFIMNDFDSATSTYQISINNVVLGSFISAYTDSNATVQAAINVVLAPTYICVVSGNSFTARSVIISSPTGSGGAYNGFSLVVTVTAGSGLITSQQGFTGGLDNSNQPGCDCRSYQSNVFQTEGSNIGVDDNYTIPVFAHSTCIGADIENDKTPFYFSYPSLNPNQLIAANAVFTLQKWNETTQAWVDKATLNNNTYGTYYGFGSFTGHSNWTGYKIAWCKVNAAFGEGIYRVKLISSIYATPPTVGTPATATSCMASKEYCLKTYSCYAADRTVRFEAYLSGVIGDIDNDGKTFDICPTKSLYDQIRIPGFFGYEKTEYEEMNIEYATGQIKKIRDKAMQKFDCMLGTEKGLPKWALDHFKTYGLMADILQVTDYNWNNSDYLVKQKYVKKAGGFTPEYHTYTRLAKVKIAFEESIQNVLKTTCCS